MSQFRREIKRESKSFDYPVTKGDSLTSEIKKGGLQRTSAKFYSEKPPMGVRGLPAMSDSLEGQLNHDTSAARNIPSTISPKIDISRGRNYEANKNMNSPDSTIGGKPSIVSHRSKSI